MKQFNRVLCGIVIASMMTTLVLFVLVYGVVFTMGIYYINRLIARGPQDPTLEPRRGGGAPAPSSAPSRHKVLIETERTVPSEHVV